MNRIARLSLRLLVAASALAAHPPSAAADATALRGAGATFPYPIYAKWAAEYKRATGVDIAYEAVGSGAGIDLVERGMVDFGASDVPLVAEALQRMGVMQFPAIIGGVVPVMNVSGIGSGALRLSGEVLAQIYLGKITKWNDPAIAALNPGLHLPSTFITVVHRSDASGTTFLWSEFLSRSSAEWRATVGVDKVLAWPAGVASTGNEGVASSVQRTKASIGYVEYAYAEAHHLTTVSVRNRAGAFVQPGEASFEAAAQAARWRRAPDLYQLLIDQPGAASWPITGGTFILLRTTADQPARSLDVLKFFDWALHHGQRLAIDLDYVPVPEPALELIDAAWADQIRSASGEAVWTRRGSPHR
ncbi:MULTISPECIES: phosphate ABC transporter substrate-binding protein PstS [Cupriavidus]